jgi:hypothetical protein
MNVMLAVIVESRSTVTLPTFLRRLSCLADIDLAIHRIGYLIDFHGLNVVFFPMWVYDQGPYLDFPRPYREWSREDQRLARRFQCP